MLAIGIWLLRTPVAFLDDSAVIIIAASSEKMFANLVLNLQAAVALYALPSARKLPSAGGSTESLLKDVRIQGPGDSALGLGLPLAATLLHKP